MHNVTLSSINDSAILDAFGRLRVSEPFTIFDSKQCFNDGNIADNAENYPLLFDNQQLSGGGTSTTYSATRASTTLAVSNATAGVRVRQTRQWFDYQPGKSQLIFLTGVLNGAGNGIIHRYGLFTATAGLFFETFNGIKYVTRRTNGTDQRVAQADWNLDRLDGTGPSSITLDVTKTNIYILDFEWLGVGRVRFGVVIDGKIVYCHEMLHANVLTAVYINTPNLPIRAEIQNSGTGNAASLEMICASVISEGGFNPNGIMHLWSNEATPITAAATANRYALLGIRLRSSHMGVTILPEYVSVYSGSTNDVFLWTLHINPTINNAFVYADLPNSAVQVATGVATNTLAIDGTIIEGGYCAKDTGLTIDLQNSLRIGADIAGTSDTLVLAVRPLAVNTDAVGLLAWREVI